MGAELNSFQESAYVPKSKPRATSVLEGDEITFQQQKHDHNKIIKPVKEEWDQSDLWLANHTQNSNQIFLLKSTTDLSGLGTGLVRSTQKTYQNSSHSSHL
jgi:hypothetical protein